MIDSPKMQNGIVEVKVDNIESEIGDTEIVHPPLKYKVKTRE